MRRMLSRNGITTVPASFKCKVSGSRLKSAEPLRQRGDAKPETRNLQPRARGVTLVEMIVVITITGIIGAGVAMFIRRPVEGYIDATRRAELTETADTALRRITRDLRTALPNSIRIATVGNVSYIEYLQTIGGGRYRAELDSLGGGDPLDFLNPAGDASFDVIGALPPVAAGMFIVVYNLSADPGVPTANAYTGDNRANVSSAAGTTITLSPAHRFPFTSPGKRFQVVQYPVSYACDPLPAGTGELRRYWGYAIQAAQPTPPAGGNNALLATNVTNCSFSYITIGGAMQRTGVVAVNLEVSQTGEAVRLFQQVHVSNAP
jgi:MSHA biogenesis protein MshO